MIILLPPCLGVFLNSERKGRINALLKRTVNYRFTENIYDFDWMLLHTDCRLYAVQKHPVQKSLVSIVVFQLLFNSECGLLCIGTKCIEIRFCLDVYIRFHSVMITFICDNKSQSIYLSIAVMLSNSDVPSGLRTPILKSTYHHYCTLKMHIVSKAFEIDEVSTDR